MIESSQSWQQSHDCLLNTPEAYVGLRGGRRQAGGRLISHISQIQAPYRIQTNAHYRVELVDDHERTGPGLDVDGDLIRLEQEYERIIGMQRVEATVRQQLEQIRGMHLLAAPRRVLDDA